MFVEEEELKELLIAIQSSMQPKKETKTAEKPIKNKMEFSKKWLIGCIVFSVLFTCASYILSAFDKNPVESLSAQIVQSVWAMDGICFVGYNIQNCVRAHSLNKYVENNGTGGGNENRRKG